MMSLRESTILKGVAILFMLYLHLFNRLENVDLCITHLSVGNIPLVHLFTRCTNPVPFYLILSGYGLYASYKNGKKQNSLKRVLKLYIHYWITLVLFVFLGCWVIGSEIYPGSFEKILENFCGWRTSYNSEIWFLFPYILLVFFATHLFRFLDRVAFLPTILIISMLLLASNILISLFGSSYLYSHYWALKFVLYMGLLFPFMLGAMMVKYDIVNKFKIRGGFLFVVTDCGW